MLFLYDLIVRIAWVFLQPVALINSKIKLFVQGRKRWKEELLSVLSEEDKTIWIHAASLGEFEQGLPIIERLKAAYKDHKIVVTFFSPSGYETQKNGNLADVISYLPMDTRKNATEFLTVVHPRLAVFIKYEIWPNYLRLLNENKVPTVLVSAFFRPDQVFFKPYGAFMRSALHHFTHIFVQNEDSKKLLEDIGVNRNSVSGDTRLDRVSEILERDNELHFMNSFKKKRLCVVAGSTWPDDEGILVDYINHAPAELCFVLAPHVIKAEKVMGLASSITRKTALYSKLDVTSKDFDVLIVDTIGLLTKIYSYADIAYVGGGFGTGLHNTMEPAVFGIPIVIGPEYKGFKEAEELVQKKGILPVSDAFAFGEVMKRLLGTTEFRKRTGQINVDYVTRNRGASIQIMNYLRTLL